MIADLFLENVAAHDHLGSDRIVEYRPGTFTRVPKFFARRKQVVLARLLGQRPVTRFHHVSKLVAALD